MDITAGNIALKGVTAFNVIVGRNGAGKSRFLRQLCSALRNNQGYNCAIVNPERSGYLNPDASVENAMRNNKNWIFDSRNQNQSIQFKASAVVRLKDTRTSFLLKMQDDLELRYSSKTFETEYVSDINGMLRNVQLVSGAEQITFANMNNEQIDADKLSSGESEAISLAAEVLYFLEGASKDKINIMFIDEPDVHLHPDLQSRLIAFIHRRWLRLGEEIRSQTLFIIASHSTPLLGALTQIEQSAIGVKLFDSETIELKSSADALKNTASFFAHPLSSVFNLERPLILEGEDDERIWEQVCRSSRGAISLFVCLADSVDKQHELEKFFSEMLPAFYDHPEAFSVRDGDGKIEELNDVGCVKRFRLGCYSGENMLLADETLESLGHAWKTFCEAALLWVKENPKHQAVDTIAKLAKFDNRMRQEKIKAIRQDIVSICKKKAPWEVVVGKSIASLKIKSDSGFSLESFVGAKLLAAIGLALQPPPQAPEP